MSERSFSKPSQRAPAASEAAIDPPPEAGPHAKTDEKPTAKNGEKPAAKIGEKPAADIDITVNGEPRRVAAGTTVAALLRELGLGDRRVAVERNRAVVPRAEHARVELAAGDHLELVTFVGGG